MSMIDEKYTIEPGQHGTVLITKTGRCTHDEAADIEADCTRRYELVVFPQADGVVLKSMDGTTPSVVEVTPPTVAVTYRCVKIEGRVTPFAYTQPDGPYQNKAILKYIIKYQQVGEVS
jgi:hypothetical protein